MVYQKHTQYRDAFFFFFWWGGEGWINIGMLVHGLLVKVMVSPFDGADFYLLDPRQVHIGSTQAHPIDCG